MSSRLYMSRDLLVYSLSISRSFSRLRLPPSVLDAERRVVSIRPISEELVRNGGSKVLDLLCSLWKHLFPYGIRH